MVSYLNNAWRKKKVQLEKDEDVDCDHYEDFEGDLVSLITYFYFSISVIT